MKSVCLVVLGLLLMAGGATQAHTLGVDKADLVELPEGRYHLVSRVPQSLAHLITSPRLPDSCDFTGSPRGTRGVYEVRFEFRCEPKLRSGDLIILPWQREGAMLTVAWQEAPPVTRFAAREGGVIQIDLTEYLAESGSFWAGARRYTLLGMEHILEGIDHLLFVLALLFVVQGGWRLIKTITAFTVAHSITLALATLGYINMPSAPVEATIALSVVFLCVEIVHSRQGRAGLTFTYPWVVAFAFGLLHGLGFAGALSEIGLPPQEIPVALLFFNIGVELGQVAFVGIIYAIAIAFGQIWRVSRESRAYILGERVIVYAIGITASFWLIERSLAVFHPV